MARMIRLDATGPIKIPPSEETVYICACGLSQKLPYCDGAHKRTHSEPDGEVCVYDDARCEIVRREPARD